MKRKTIKKVARVLLGSTLAFAGTSHLTFARDAFRDQVPNWVPLDKDTTVLASGLVEIGLGGALVLTDEAHQETIGKVAAAFFTAIFPGNIAQLINHRDAFGLDTDVKRFVRLLLQPGLVYWALKSTEYVGSEKN
jgi:uncharacterized membrane protein